MKDASELAVFFQKGDIMPDLKFVTDVEFDLREFGPVKRYQNWLREVGSYLDENKRRKRNERMVLITGEPGTGKTLGATAFAEREPWAVYVKMPTRAEMSKPERPRELLKRICDGVDLPLQNSNAETVRALCAFLKDNPRVLMFDDAHNQMRYHVMQLLRVIHDPDRPTRKPAVPIVFIGIPPLEAWFRQNDEFRSRVHASLKMKDCTAGEVRELLGDYSAEVASSAFKLTNGRLRDVVRLRASLDQMCEKSNKRPLDVQSGQCETLMKAFMLPQAA